MMTQDMTFRALLLMSFVLGWIVRFNFTGKNKNPKAVKSINVKRETLAFNLGNLAFSLPLLYIFTDWLNFANWGLPVWLRWLGVIILFSGNVILYLAHSNLGKNWSGTLDIQEKHTLITNGIYQYIRHPMYLGFLLLIIGIFLTSANVLLGVAMLSWFAYMYLGRVAKEEQMMIEQFGEQYRTYMQRTGRLLPKFDNLRS